MIPMAFLYAMQAAGAIQRYSQIRQSQKLENAQFNANLESLRLTAAQESLAEANQLRQNIGSQIAWNAAHGGGGGSITNSIGQSVSAYQQDERIRAINLLAQENQLKGQNLLSMLDAKNKKRKIVEGFAKNVVNTVNTSSFTWGNT